MQFQLTTLPASDPATVADELHRFIANVGQVGFQMVVVQPPYAKRPLHVWLLDVPDAVAPWVEDRLLPILLGPTGTATRTGAVVPRAEWTRHALLLPTRSAQALDPLLLRGWTSAHLQGRWTPGRCGALLHYSPEDTARLDEIRAVGWRVVPLKPLVTRVVRHPILTWRSPLLPRLTSAGPVAAQASIPAPAAATSPDLTAKTSQLTQPLLEPLPSVLAGPGEPGLLLGVTPQDAGVRLAWRAIACAIDAPVPRQRAAFLALLRRAFEQGMGVVAIVPRGLLSQNALQPWADRLRVLDGERNPIESAAIPWQLLSPAALTEVVAGLDITTPLPDPMPSEFGALLHQLDAADLCTQAVLIATARPGDDLLGVAAQGGGVVLVDTDDPGSDLLGSLLLQIFAECMTGDRPLMLVRPARLPIPPALADRCLQIVLGRSAAAVVTLTAQPEQWLLTEAQGEIVLDADLTRTPSEIAEGDHAALVMTLMGGEGAAPLPTLPVAPERDLPPAAEARAERPAEPPVVPALLPAAHAPESAVAPALLPPAHTVEPVERALPSPGTDQPLAAGQPPVAADAVVLEDWSEALGDTIAEIDPAVTDPVAFAPRIVPRPTVPEPSSAAADTFDWWALADDVSATLGGTSAVAANDAAPVAAAPTAQPPMATPTPVTTFAPDDQLPLPSRDGLLELPVAWAASEPTAHDTGAALPGVLPAAPEPEVTNPDVRVPARPEVLAITLAPLAEDWDVRLGDEDRDAIASATIPGARVNGAAGTSAGYLPVAPASEHITATPASPPPPKPWLRPQRRGWRPGLAPQRTQALVASEDREDPAQGDSSVLRSESGTLGELIPAGDLLAAMSSVPEQRAGETGEAAITGQDLAAAEASDHADRSLAVPAVDLPLPLLVQDEALPVLLVTAPDGGDALAGVSDQAAPATVDAGAVPAQEDLRTLAHWPAIDEPLAAHGRDEREAGPSPRMTAVPGADDRGEALGSTLVARAGSGAPAADPLPLPDPSVPLDAAPPTARPWPDVDHATIIWAWRGGRTAPELVQQLQAMYPEVAPGELRTAVRSIIQAALHYPAAVPPVPPLAPLTPPVQDPALSVLDQPSSVAGVPGAAVLGEAVAATPDVPVLAPSVEPITSGMPLDPSAPAGDPLLPLSNVTLAMMATDDQIWAAWLAGMDLNEMIRGLSGLTPRSVPGQAARDRIHQVVVPRIVAELGVDTVVGRWLAGAPLGDSERESFELLLQRMNRQTHPVTGTIRTKTEQRLIGVMQPLLEARSSVVEG